MDKTFFTNPKAPTLVASYLTTISSSNEISMATGTTYLVVTAIDKGIFLRWGGSAASSSAFDEFIGVGQTVIFVRPANTAKVQLIQESATGKVVVLEK